MTLNANQVVEIKRGIVEDEYDEYDGCEAVVIETARSGKDVLVAVKAGHDVWIARSRLKPAR